MKTTNKKYYELWSDNGTSRKIYITSSYETTCKDMGREFHAFICRMSNGMTFYTGKGWQKGYLTWHQVRKGTEVNNTSDVDLFNTNGKINTMKQFISHITL